MNPESDDNDPSREELIRLADEVAPILELPVAERWAHYFGWKGYTNVQATRLRAFCWRFTANLPDAGRLVSHDQVKDDVVGILAALHCKPRPLGILVGIEEDRVAITADFEADEGKQGGLHPDTLVSPPDGI